MIQRGKEHNTYTVNYYAGAGKKFEIMYVEQKSTEGSEAQRNESGEFSNFSVHVKLKWNSFIMS